MKRSEMREGDGADSPTRGTSAPLVRVSAEAARPKTYENETALNKKSVKYDGQINYKLLIVNYINGVKIWERIVTGA
jgi:hypothetical protein